jgi:hypothetical protein
LQREPQFRPVAAELAEPQRHFRRSSVVSSPLCVQLRTHTRASGPERSTCPASRRSHFPGHGCGLQSSGADPAHRPKRRRSWTA